MTRRLYQNCVKAVWMKDGRGYIASQPVMHKVPVQFGKWSEHSRLIHIEAICKQEEGSYRVYCIIDKKFVGGGRRFEILIPKDQIEKVVEQGAICKSCLKEVPALTLDNQADADAIKAGLCSEKCAEDYCGRD